MNEIKNDNEQIDHAGVLEYSPVPCTTTTINTSQPSSNKSMAHDKFTTKSVQWASSDGVIYFPTAQTTPYLAPGFYEIGVHDMLGLYFEKVPISLDNIFVFQDDATNVIFKEIQDFWNKEHKYIEYGLTYKRGILAHGPPGNGKSTALQLISKDIIERGGIVIKFTYPGVFSSGLRKLREIQPDVPIVVILEDLDSIIRNYCESDVINILDGVDKLNNIVFLATSNYLELLGDRLVNRPSRFDRRIKFLPLSSESRQMYFEYLIGDHVVDIDLNQWVKDTKDLSIAHLKELFTSVIVFENEYEKEIKRLKDMQKRESSTDNGNKLGFVGN